jgi:hypothetical protein
MPDEQPCWIVSDDWGPDFLQIEVTDLRLLQRDGRSDNAGEST